MDIPPNGYWHCQLVLKGNKNTVVQKDMSFDHIIKYIVKPFRSNSEFNIGGKLIENRSKIDTLKLFFTTNNFESYGYIDPPRGVIMIPAPAAWRKSTEYTQDLLYSEEFAQEFERIKPTPANPSHVININQSNNQTQHTEVNINLAYNDIERLQDIFDSWRSSLGNISDADYLRLKEAQDALDTLSPASSQQEACGALNKVKRVLKFVGDGVSTIGRAAAGCTETIENISKLKIAYNSAALLFGLPTL